MLFRYLGILSMACGVVVLPIQAEPALSNGIYSLEIKVSGNLLRPENAQRKDGTHMVLYPEYNWKCLKWAVETVDGKSTFRNLFTGKTFQAEPTEQGATRAVVQHSIVSGQAGQQWEIEALPDSFYRVRLAGTDLYLSGKTNEGEVNSEIVVESWKDKPSQYWKLTPKERRSDA